MQEFRSLIKDLCDEVALSTDDLMRANQRYIEEHALLNFGSSSSDSF